MTTQCQPQAVPSSAADTVERMACMEVWGGNRATDTSFVTPGLRVRVFSRPFEDAVGGGDVYYVSTCASGRITRLMLADVCGHGSRVSRTAERLRRLMQKNVNNIDHRRLVSCVNQEFSESLEDSRFATALVGTFFSPFRRLTICNAGHPPPFVYRAASGEWSMESDPTEWHESNFPFGLDPDTSFDSHQLRMNDGDVVLMYTDALTDVSTRDATLGVGGLLNVLRECDGSRPADLLEELMGKLQTRATDAIQDDTTVVILEATGSSVPLRDTLAAPFRFMKSFFSR